MLRRMKRMLFVFAMTAAAFGCKKSSSGDAAKPTPAAGSAAEAVPAEAPPAEPTPEAKPAEPAPPPTPKKATATLAPASKSKVKGTIEFTEVEGGVGVVANLQGLTPGDHGYHVHEKGDCSAPDAKTADGHFNPNNLQHGAPDAPEHHE